MKVIARDSTNLDGSYILEATGNEVALLLGLMGWYDLTRTGSVPVAGSEIGVEKIATCARVIREEKGRLERLRSEYATRILELDDLIAFADSRWAEPEKEIP